MTHRLVKLAFAMVALGVAALVSGLIWPNHPYLIALGLLLMLPWANWRLSLRERRRERTKPPHWQVTVTDAQQAAHTWRVVAGAEHLAMAQVGDEVQGHLSRDGLYITGIGQRLVRAPVAPAQGAGATQV